MTGRREPGEDQSCAAVGVCARGRAQAVQIQASSSEESGDAGCIALKEPGHGVH